MMMIVMRSTMMMRRTMRTMMRKRTDYMIMIMMIRMKTMRTNKID